MYNIENTARKHRASGMRGYLVALFKVDEEFDCDERPTVKLDFPPVPIFRDWLNCLPDRLFNLAVVDCDEGVEGDEGIGSGSVSGVLNEKQPDHELRFAWQAKVSITTFVGLKSLNYLVKSEYRIEKWNVTGAYPKLGSRGCFSCWMDERRRDDTLDKALNGNVSGIA